MSSTHVLSFVLGAAIASAAAPLVQEKAKDASASQQQPQLDPAAAQKMQDEAMARWMKACAPGENQKKLERFLGKWTTESKMWMSGQEGVGQPMVDRGTAETKWFDDGRWLVTEYHDTLMGQPRHAMSILGYDNFKQAYVGCFVDSMTTTLLTFQGKLSQDGNDLVMYGAMDEPMTGENDKLVKYAWRMHGQDAFNFEVYDLAIGETNCKVIGVTYTRAK